MPGGRSALKRHNPRRRVSNDPPPTSLLDQEEKEPVAVAERSPREVISTYTDAMNRGDWALLREVLAADYIEDYPQSGERIRGPENAVAVRDRFPRGNTAIPDTRNVGARLTVGGEDRWAMAPNFTAIKVASDGDNVTSLVRAIYPDGPWYVVYIASIERGRIKHATVIFGAMFEAPEWRRQWVEAMPEDER